MASISYIGHIKTVTITIMHHNTTRVLIADLQTAYQVQLKRLINSFGFSRVASVSSFRELLTMTHYSCEPFENFDVLLLNNELAFAAGVDAEELCCGNPQIKYALIYGGRSQGALSLRCYTSDHHKVYWVNSLTPNSLYNFMSYIDKSLTLKKFSQYDEDRQIITKNP